MEGAARSLFPAYAPSTSSGQPSTSTAAGLSSNVPSTSVVTGEVLQQRFDSFDPALLERDFLAEEESKRKAAVPCINLEDEDVSSDSSVVVVLEKRNRRFKRKKKDNKKNNDNRKPRLPCEMKVEEEHGIYISKIEGNCRKVVFLEDIPGLQPKDAYVIDRKSGNNYRLPLYSARDVLHFDTSLPKVSESKEDESKKKKLKTRRYFNKFLSNNGLHIVSKADLFNNQAVKLEFIPVAPLPSRTEEVQGNNNDTIRFRSMAETEEEPLTVGPSRVPNRLQLLHDLVANFHGQLHVRFADDTKEVRTWVDFVCLQDLIAFAENAEQRSRRLSKKRADHEAMQARIIGAGGGVRHYLEKKLAIVDRAIERHRRSLELHLLRTTLRSEHYTDLGLDCATIDGDWKQLGFLFPGERRVWLDWIRFSQRTKAMFEFRAVSRTRKIFRQAFRSYVGKFLEGGMTISGSPETMEQEVEGRAKVERILVDMLQYLSQFYRSIDQSEKAIALWQAAIEFNLHRPEKFDAEVPFDDAFLLFEQYWDSNSARIGEFDPMKILERGDRFRQKSLVGWAKFERNVVDRTPEPKDQANMRHFNTDRLLDECEEKILVQLPEDAQPEMKAAAWIQLEHITRLLHWLPASAGYPLEQSMELVEDLERVVLCDEDVQPFLFRIESPDVRFYLVLNFLLFLELDLVTFGLNAALSTSGFEPELVWENESYDDGVSEAFLGPRSERRLLFDGTSRRTRVVGDRYGSPAEEYVVKDLGVRLDDESVSKVIDETHEAFVDNVLRQAIEDFGESPEKKLTLILVWVRHRNARLEAGKETPAKIKAFLKDFLRRPEYRNCPELWFAYCRFEYRQDRAHGTKLFAQTIQLMLAGGSDRCLLKKFVLGFVRLALELDTTLEHYLRHSTPDSRCCFCQPEAELETIRLEMKAARVMCLKILSAVLQNRIENLAKLDWSAPGTPVSMVEVRRAIHECQTKWTLETPAEIEDVQALALVIYLIKGLEAFQETIEFHLLPESMAMLRKTFPFKNVHQTERAIERSHYLLYVQTILLDHLSGEVGGGSEPQSNCLVIVRALVYRILTRLLADPLFLALVVVLETRTFNSMFRARKFLSTIGSTTRELEHYFFGRYLQQGYEDGGPAWLASQSLVDYWNIFFASLHLEMSILEEVIKTNDFSGFELTSSVRNRIRNLFERSLNYRGEAAAATVGGGNFQLQLLKAYGKSLAQCPTIWRLFFRFELVQDRAKAKTVLYRAMQACPDCKQIYLEGVEHFPELWLELSDTLVDKQLRVRTAVEEVELLARAKKIKASQTGDGED